MSRPRKFRSPPSEKTDVTPLPTAEALPVRYSRTQPEIERDRTDVARLYVKGYSHKYMADWIYKQRGYRVPLSTIANDLTAIRTKWQDSYVERINSHLVEQLARIDTLEHTYWQAWEASRRTQEELATKSGTNAAGAYSEDVKRLKNPVGDKAFLTGVGECIDRRSKLLGLYAETSAGETTNNAFTFNFVAPPVPDPTEDLAAYSQYVTITPITSNLLTDEN